MQSIILNIIDWTSTLFHTVILPILGVFGAYYLLLRYYGFRMIQWTEEMEMKERKEWSEQFNAYCKSGKQNLGEEELLKYQKEQEKLRKIEELMKSRGLL